MKKRKGLSRKLKSKKSFFRSPIWIGISGMIPVFLVLSIFGVSISKSRAEENNLVKSFNLNKGKSYLDLSELVWELGDKELSANMYAKWADQVNADKKQSVVLGVWDTKEVSLSEYKELRTKLTEIEALSEVVKSRFLLEKEADILTKLGFSYESKVKLGESKIIDSVDKLN